jgi:hypothetical protein
VKKLVLSLLGAAAMATISSSAMALNTLIPQYKVLLSRGPAQIPSGLMSFFFDLDVPGAACQYAAEWDDATFAPLSGECYLDEAKPLGNFSCPVNSTMPVASILTLDTTAVGGPCFGFDYFQQYRQVFTLVLGESPASPELQGVVQFTGGAPIVYGMDLHP